MMAAGLLRLPSRILFGCGAAAAAGGAAGVLGRRAVVCTDETIARTPVAGTVLRSLRAAGVDARVFSGTEPDVPLACVHEATEFARRKHTDLVIGLGGGSCLDVAKTVALMYAGARDIESFYGESAIDGDVLPVVAIPTTAGTGSEVTPVAVLTDPARELKVGISSQRLIPAVAICDPEATLGCPPAVTGMAGIDALIHAVEAYCAPARENPWRSYPGDVFRGRDPLSRPYALVAVDHIAGALERAYAHGDDVAAREAMMFGSLCAGMAFAHAGTASAHALQYPIGAATGTPHGLGVGLLAPYTLAAARPAVDDDLRDLARALGAADTGSAPPEAAIDEIQRLGRAVGIPSSLAEIGVARADLPRHAQQAAGIERLVRNSPRPMTQTDLLRVLDAAWAGDRTRLARTAGAAAR